MTKHEINAAIAESLGWKMHPDQEKWDWLRPDGRALVGKSPFPNYAEDLNAMSEAEKALTDGEYIDFCNNLLEITSPEYIADDAWASRSYLSSKAIHRAEAFLRTIGKWKEAE